jgi:hypothetical protein
VTSLDRSSATWTQSSQNGPGETSRRLSRRQHADRAATLNRLDEFDFDSSIKNTSLIRRGPNEVDFKAPNTPSVRVILSPCTPESDNLKFDPIEFELYNDGPSVNICRTERSANQPATFSKGEVRFGSRVISRKSHAQVWCENDTVSISFCNLMVTHLSEKVFVQDTGSKAGSWLNEFRMAENPLTVSHPLGLSTGNILRIGEDYDSGASLATLFIGFQKLTYTQLSGDLSCKCVRAMVTIEYFPQEVTFKYVVLQSVDD